MKTMMMTAVAFMALAAGADTLELKSLPGEKWWGGATRAGVFQPYENIGKRSQYINNDSNQVSPFFVSSAGRYIWSEKPVAWSATNGNLTVYSKAKVELHEAGSTLKEAFLAAAKRHFPSTGTLPDELFFSRPQWNQGSESLFVGINQHQVEQYACAIVGNGFPLGVFIVDDGWERDFGVWEFDPQKFPDPKGMVEKLHNLGAKVMLWLVPFVSPDSIESLDLVKRRLVLERPKSELTNPDQGPQAIIKWWSGYSFAYDLSIPETKEYLTEKFRGLMRDYGVDGFKFDASDFWHFTLAAPTGYEFRKPGYTVQDNCHDWSMFAADYPFNEMRASYNTAGQPLVQRLQDKAHSWGDLQALVPDMLAAGILGYAYTCADMIGGGLAGCFKDEKFKLDHRLFVRSCQTHALMPMMQFSVAPWRVLTKEEMAICRDAANLHVEFASYILSLAHHSSKTGEPIVRYMEYEFPHQGLETVRDQFMLGPDWLVAPVVNADDSRTVRLPKGTWTDDLGETHIGPKTLELTNVPLDRLPRFHRKR